MQWHITSQPDDKTLHSLLAQNRIFNAYGLNDLQPPFRIRSRYWLAQHTTDWAILLLYRTTTFMGLLPFGDARGIEKILEYAQDLPITCIVSNGNNDYRTAMSTRYRLGREESLVRTVAHYDSFTPYKNEMQQQFVRLTPQDIGDMAAFYMINNVPTFSPDQVHNGIYYGIRRHGTLVAVGGTYFVNRRDRIGAVGNIYTDPALRGNGYVRLLISELTKGLFAEGCHEVIHDVKYNDYAMRQVYEPLGFENMQSFWEATARLR